jgi:hypothetical protein
MVSGALKLCLARGVVLGHWNFVRRMKSATVQNSPVATPNLDLPSGREPYELMSIIPTGRTKRAEPLPIDGPKVGVIFGDKLRLDDLILFRRVLQSTDLIP